MFVLSWGFPGIPVWRTWTEKCSRSTFHKKLRGRGEPKKQMLPCAVTGHEGGVSCTQFLDPLSCLKIYLQKQLSGAVADPRGANFPQTAWKRSNCIQRTHPWRPPPPQSVNDLERGPILIYQILKMFVMRQKKNWSYFDRRDFEKFVITKKLSSVKSDVSCDGSTRLGLGSSFEIVFYHLFCTWLGFLCVFDFF